MGLSNRRIKGGILTTIGFLLSPLSWWNDIFINLPLAYLFGFLFGLISQKLFFPMLIVGYWITNLLGFLLMHYGAKELLLKQKPYTKKEIIKDILFSAFYTLIIILLIKIGILKFPFDYFQ